MSNTALTSGTMLPRFLLPRLSWQTTPIHQNTMRALSTLPNSHRSPSKRAQRPLAIHPRGSAPLNANPHSRILQNLSHRRAFHATTRQSRDHHFDTLKFVQRLQEEGFTEAQSAAMMKVLSDVIEERQLFPSSPSP